MWCTSQCRAAEIWRTCVLSDAFARKTADFGHGICISYTYMYFMIFVSCIYMCIFLYGHMFINFHLDTVKCKCLRSFSGPPPSQKKTCLRLKQNHIIYGIMHLIFTFSLQTLRNLFCNLDFKSSNVGFVTRWTRYNSSCTFSFGVPVWASWQLGEMIQFDFFFVPLVF